MRTLEKPHALRPMALCTSHVHQLQGCITKHALTITNASCCVASQESSTQLLSCTAGSFALAPVLRKGKQHTVHK